MYSQIALWIGRRIVGKQGTLIYQVATKEIAPSCFPEAEVSRRMPRRVQGLNGSSTQIDGVTIIQHTARFTLEDIILVDIKVISLHLIGPVDDAAELLDVGIA